MSEVKARAGPKYQRLSDAQKNEIVDALRARLFRQEDIIIAYLHGSFLEKGGFKDVDVAVWTKGYADPLRYAVDLSVEAGAGLGLPLDIHAINRAPLPVKYRVLTKGKPIFCRDEKLRSSLVDEIIRQYLDLEFLRRDSSGIKE